MERWRDGEMEYWSVGVKQSEKKSWECAKEGSEVESPLRKYLHWQLALTIL
jgi:hypothetical protein